MFALLPEKQKKMAPLFLWGAKQLSVMTEKRNESLVCLCIYFPSSSQWGNFLNAPPQNGLDLVRSCRLKVDHYVLEAAHPGKKLGHM